MDSKVNQLDLWKARIKNFLRGDFLRAKSLTAISEVAYIIAKRYGNKELYFVTNDKKKYGSDISFLNRFKLLPKVYVTESIDESIINSVVLCDIFDENLINNFSKIYSQGNIIILYGDNLKKYLSGIREKYLFYGKAHKYGSVYIFDERVTNSIEKFDEDYNDLDSHLRGNGNAEIIDNFKIQAIVTCYNEQDITGHTIEYLTNQGIYVHVIDNWSTDDSEGIIESFVSESELVTSEKFPVSGPTETYDWGNILSRVQTIAMDNSDKFDWFVHHDADEVREAPFENVASLRQGIEIVDKCGFNAIDHTVINFALVKDGFDGTQKLEEWFEYFDFGKKKDFHHKQIKAWKSNSNIDLVSSGGHIAKFENMRVFPYRFLLKHYPMRSVIQAKRKVFAERKNRWNKEEKQKNWHKQYDDINEDYNFLKNKEDFIEYDRNNFYHNYLIKAVLGVDDE